MIANQGTQQRTNSTLIRIEALALRFANHLSSTCAWLAGTVALLVVSGCGSGEQVNLIPVQGEVFSGDEPAVGAVVVLNPPDRQDREKWPRGYPHGLVAEDGTFEISTPPQGKGAPSGDYKLTVTWPQPVEGSAPDDPEPETEDRLDGRWSQPAQSSVTVTVTPPETEVSRVQLEE